MSYLRKGQLRLPFFLILLTVAVSAHAGQQIQHLDLLVDEPQIINARLHGATLKKWLVLSYYHDLGDSRYYSEIDNADFFLAEQGSTDPLAEFEAFKRLAIGFIRNGSQAEILCRFPARWRLLKNSVGGARAVREPDCPDYIEEMRPEALTGISLIFASGYFDNPSSYYGHTLLKLNYADDKPDDTSLDRSLNYGADIVHNPSHPLYVINGLLGGYTASYTRNSYFLHSYLYTSAQIRDTWEYELELTPEQVRFIAEHSWEMSFARFPYYFFNDNCAHRIARLVEVATGRDLSSTHGFWLLPSQVVRRLASNEEGRPLLRKSHYNPSLRTRFTERFTQLERAERHRFVEYFESDLDGQRKRAKGSSTALLKIKLDYLDLEAAKLRLNEESVADSVFLQRRRGLILAELFRRPATSGPIGEEVTTPVTSPIDAKPPSYLRFGVGAREGGLFSTLGYRIANNDLLSQRTPGQEVSRFLMGDLELEIEEGDAELSRLVIFDVVNVNTNPLPGHMTHERSWSLKLDYAARSRSCVDCRDFGFEGRIGKALRPSSKGLVYGFVGGRAHTQSGEDDDFFTFISELGSVFHPTSRTDTVMNIAGRGYLGSKRGAGDWVWNIDLAWNPKSRFDLRVGLEIEGSERTILGSFAYYFD